MERLATKAKPPTEREMIASLGETVAESLPEGWESQVRVQPAARVDALLQLIGPDGRSASFLVEVKSVVDPRDVPVIREQLLSSYRGEGPYPLVVARYLSPRAREALVESGMSYMDSTGNLRLVTREPALFILREGTDSDPWRSRDRPTSSLRGKPAARVVRALVDQRPPWKVRELAKAAGTSLGSTARTLEFLAREALVERDGSGAIVEVAWPALLERWAADYDLASRRRVLKLIAPRGPASIAETLRAWPKTYAVTGSLAAAQWAPYAEARLGILYAPDADELSERLGLREAPSGPNLLVIEPDDDVVFARAVEADGLRFAAPSQVAVDLLAGPGRNPEEGLALIRWMQANEAKWRRG